MVAARRFERGFSGFTASAVFHHVYPDDGQTVADLFNANTGIGDSDWSVTSHLLLM
jgi:hypothetical protein